MTLSAIVIIGSLLVVAAWELWRPRRRRTVPALRRCRANIGLWLVNLLLTAFLLEPPVPARGRIEELFGVHLPIWPVANAAVSFVAGFLLLDLLCYLMHRCEHAVPFLWRFHALHHSDLDLDVTTSVRHHPVEYVLSSIFQWLAVITLGIPATVVLYHVTACFAMAAVTHGNLRLPEWLERWLRPVVITVDLHRLHHSALAAEANSNYGAVLSIWDRLFGTYTQFVTERHEVIRFGVRELTDTILTPLISSRY